MDKDITKLSGCWESSVFKGILVRRSVLTFNFSTQVAEAGGYLWDQGQNYVDSVSSKYIIN